MATTPKKDYNPAHLKLGEIVSEKTRLETTREAEKAQEDKLKTSVAQLEEDANRYANGDHLDQRRAASDNRGIAQDKKQIAQLEQHAVQIKDALAQLNGPDRKHAGFAANAVAIQDRAIAADHARDVDAAENAQKAGTLRKAGGGIKNLPEPPLKTLDPVKDKTEIAAIKTEIKEHTSHEVGAYAQAYAEQKTLVSKLQKKYHNEFIESSNGRVYGPNRSHEVTEFTKVNQEDSHKLAASDQKLWDAKKTMDSAVNKVLATHGMTGDEGSTKDLEDKRKGRIGGDDIANETWMNAKRMGDALFTHHSAPKTTGTSIPHSPASGQTKGISH